MSAAPTSAPAPSVTAMPSSSGQPSGAKAGSGDPSLEGVRATTRANGSVVWRHPDTYQPHRLGGPARIHYGVHSWFHLGRLHREGGPAVYHPDFPDGGAEERWYVHGKFHRLDGPAWTFEDGTRLWYVHGVEVDDPADQAQLGELFDAGEYTLLETVLSVWHSGGPAVADLVCAVRAARS